MPKPNQNFSVAEMKSYIRMKKLNHPDVKLGMKKADMIAGLKKAGHWDEVAKVKKAKAKPVAKAAAPKATTSTKAYKEAYKDGYDEGKDQAETDVDSGDFGDGAEVLDPTTPMVTQYKTEDERKGVIQGWKDAYLEVMKKNGNPHLDTTKPKPQWVYSTTADGVKTRKAKTPAKAKTPKAKTPAKASPAILVDDDKNKQFLNKLIADVDAFNKKYTAAKFRKLDNEGRSKLLTLYNDDASVIQRDNLKLKDKITKNGKQTKFYDDYLELIKTVSRSFGKFTSVRKAIKKLF